MLLSGQSLEEVVQVEGTPQDTAGPSTPTESLTEAEAILEKDGVRARLLVDTEQPRLGTLLRLGVEIRAMERQKTGVAGLSSQPNPARTLRPLRRVRVEFLRRVGIVTGHQSSTTASSSSTSPAPEEGKQHLTLLYASGKSLRYPGLNPQNPPLRVLFTIPTTQLGSVVDQSWGEITMKTPYHDVQFFIRVSIGFDGPGTDWILEKSIAVQPKVWKEPRQVVIQGGHQPVLGNGDSASVSEGSTMTDEEFAREAYRLKGQDTVGANGTIRMGNRTPGDDLPPPFEGEGKGGAGAGPSRGGLPTFLESEEQMRAGEAPLPVEALTSERLIPVNYEDGEADVVNRATTVGRRESFGGELSTWVEVGDLFLNRKSKS